MDTLEEAVAHHLETDVTMADGLARGIVEPRRAAQWFLSEAGWKEPEEEIMHSMKLWLEEGQAGLMARERDALRKCRLAGYSPRGLVEVPERNVHDVDYGTFQINGQFMVGDDFLFLVPPSSGSAFASSVSGSERGRGPMMEVRVPEGLSVLPVAGRIMRLALHRGVEMIGLTMSQRKVALCYRCPDGSRFLDTVARVKARW